MFTPPRRRPARMHELPGLDSNQECQDQNLVCYRLHHRVLPRNPAAHSARPATFSFKTRKHPSRIHINIVEPDSPAKYTATG